MAEPVVGQINSRGVPNNEWDVYWYNQGLKGQTSGGTPTSGGMSDGAIDPVKDKVRSIYGSEAANLSGGVERYMSGLRGNLDKNVANADIYNQEAGRERGIAKAKAGLSGTDTSAADEQARRNSIYGAAAINETAKRDANTAYGKGVGNIISGVNRIEQQAKANDIASMPVPVAQENKGGLLDAFFGWMG